MFLWGKRELFFVVLRRCGDCRIFCLPFICLFISQGSTRIFLFKEFFPFILVGNVNKENPVKLRYVKAITHPSTFPGFSVGIYLL